MSIYEYQNNGKIKDRENLVKNIAKINKQIEYVEERFVLGEINKALYDQFNEKLGREIEEIGKEINVIEKTLSNPEKRIPHSIKSCANLYKIWESDDLSKKQNLQNIAFPEGLVYNRQTDDYRIIRKSSIFAFLSVN
jgi:hypothetical protein